MTPPPTMTTLARVGRSIATLAPHPRIVRIKGRRGEYRPAAALALDEHVEAAPGRGEIRFDAGERKALPDAVPVGAGGGDTDAAILHQHGLAAARVRVGGCDLRVDDFQRTRRLLERRRLADEAGLVESDEARHIGFQHGQFIGRLSGANLVAFFYPRKSVRMQSSI